MGLNLSSIFYNVIYGPFAQQIYTIIINIFVKYLWPVVIGAIVVLAIKRLIGHGVRDISLLSGNSRRVANKQAKIAEDIYDAVSSINDIRKL